LHYFPPLENSWLPLERSTISPSPVTNLSDVHDYRLFWRSTPWTNSFTLTDTTKITFRTSARCSPNQINKKVMKNDFFGSHETSWNFWKLFFGILENAIFLRILEIHDYGRFCIICFQSSSGVPKLGYMYPQGYICLSEGVHSKVGNRR